MPIISRSCGPGRLAWVGLTPARSSTRFVSLLAAACMLGLSGCEADVSSPAGLERSALLAPDLVARAAAETTDDPQAKWLLRRVKRVRESYVREVIDAEGDRALLATRWLLRQPDDVRASYLRDVVEAQLP